jgi:two-component system, LytTR family, sensor kinase
VWANRPGSGSTSTSCGRTAVDKAAAGAHFQRTMATLPLDPAHAEALQGHYSLTALREQRIRAVLWLTLIFWISNYVLLTLATALSGSGHLDQLIPIRVGEMALGLGFCFGIHLMLRRLPTTRKRLIALAIVAPICAETFAWAVFFAEATIYPELSLKNFTWAGAVRSIAFWTWFFLAWAGTYLAVSYSFDVREEQQVSAETRERAHVAQLRALHSQINPHFLFNSLNSVSALILDRKAAQAEEMVTKLARFLRLGLAADPTEKIALAAEIELQRTYLEIEQLRYEDLEIDVSVSDELEDARVPALILQPIIENAVKYGVAGAPPPARIAVSAWSEDRRLLLEVTDSGKGHPTKAQGAGIGLANVLQRLRLIYGDERVELTAGRLEDGSFRVRLAFPLERT